MTDSDSDDGSRDREPFWWDDNGQEMTFVENMRMLRNRRGMSQTELAKMMSAAGFGFHQPTIQRIESGHRPVKLTEAMGIARVLGSDLTTMMNDVSLPFAYRALMDEVDPQKLVMLVERMVDATSLRWHRNQIADNLADYQAAAERFHEEPLPAAVTFAEKVLERLDQIEEILARAKWAVEDIMTELVEQVEQVEQSGGLPARAHGGTPWDDDLASIHRFG